ncbi:perforin-1-like [Oncorhynchus keta]|uniref:perforin-1-like n=1 Tax=Oncorhynchus keta TaxID=8018 RepID=UPI00227B1407|nr:perforin-1-like [Oncorhynchus keta]XP_052335354.1 perforin-1-like [Oncorhynchus keta]XP_052335356.1 perforin-1-like [Oncorhynchus keta]XP_052335357.1 perforin-1-like [Oncorhynchus keta]
MASLSLSLGLLVLCTLALVHCDLHDGPVRVYDIRASKLKGRFFSKPDPYVKVWCGSSFHGKSSILKKQENPTWPDQFNFANILPNSILTLEVWDDVIGPDRHMGTCTTTIRPGTHTETCQLKKGTVYYTYSYGYSH